MNITTTMNRDQFEAHFKDNREIEYKGLTIGIMDWGDGRFDVLTPAENELGYETLNPSPYLTPCHAINFAKHLLIGPEPDNKKKSSKKKSSKPKEPKYDGPRIVRVFSRDIYIEEDTNASWEDIRVKLVNEYDLPNFKKEKVSFQFDESTGILEVFLKFNNKG